MKKTKPTTLDEILQEALARETEARDFYDGLVRQCQVDFMMDLLETLRNEESKHVEMIQNMITRLNLGENIV